MQPAFLLCMSFKKSKQYGLKQLGDVLEHERLVVYVIQKSKQYGLKQLSPLFTEEMMGCVCHSKKVNNMV